jgi:hypothetical protein
MGLNDEETLNYIEDLFGIPAEARTDIHNTADVARYVALVLESKYNDLDGRKVTTHVEADVSQAVGAVNDLVGRFADLPGLVLSGLRPPEAASGMVVPARTGGTLVRVGEAGRPEVILPTDDDARAIDLIRQAGLSRLLDGGGSSGGAMPTASPASSGPIELHLYGVKDGRDAAAELAWQMKTSGRL